MHNQLNSNKIQLNSNRNNYYFLLFYDGFDIVDNVKWQICIDWLNRDTHLFIVQTFFVFDFKILKKHACFKALCICMSCQIHVMLEVQNLAHNVITSITTSVKSFYQHKRGFEACYDNRTCPIYRSKVCVGNSRLNGEMVVCQKALISHNTYRHLDQHMCKIS